MPGRGSAGQFAVLFVESRDQFGGEGPRRSGSRTERAFICR
jgi:hypothetical protein